MMELTREEKLSNLTLDEVRAVASLFRIKIGKKSKEKLIANIGKAIEGFSLVSETLPPKKEEKPKFFKGYHPITGEPIYS